MAEELVEQEKKAVLAELQSLVKSPGWARLLEHVAEMSEPVLDRIMQPCRTREEVLQAEHDKGLVEGMQNVVNLPAMIFSQQPNGESE